MRKGKSVSSRAVHEIARGDTHIHTHTQREREKERERERERERKRERERETNINKYHTPLRRRARTIKAKEVTSTRTPNTMDAMRINRKERSSESDGYNHLLGQHKTSRSEGRRGHRKRSSPSSIWYSASPSYLSPQKIGVRIETTHTHTHTHTYTQVYVHMNEHTKRAHRQKGTQTCMQKKQHTETHTYIRPCNSQGEEIDTLKVQKRALYTTLHKDTHGGGGMGDESCTGEDTPSPDTTREKDCGPAPHSSTTPPIPHGEMVGVPTSCQTTFSSARNWRG